MTHRIQSVLTLLFLIFYSLIVNAQYGPLYWDLRGYDSIVNYRDAMNAFNQKDLKKAITILDSVSNLYASQKCFRKQYVVENEKGAMNYLSKEYEKSVEIFEKNLNRMKLHNDTLNYEYAIALRFMGYLANNYSEVDNQKLYYVQKQIDVLEKMQDESAIFVDCLGDMGLSLRGANQDIGLEYLLKSRKMAQKLDLTSSIMVLDNTITNRFALEQPYLSLNVQECLLQTASRKYYRDSVILVMLAYHVATKNKEIKNYEKAVSFFEYADSLMMATNNPHQRLITGLPLEKIQCYSLMGDKEKFVKQAHKAIEIYYQTTNGVRIDEFELYAVIGNSYLPFSIDSSLLYLNKAYQILTQNETIRYDSLDAVQTESLAKILNAQANAYVQKGKFEEAKEFILTSLRLYTGEDEFNIPNFTCNEKNDNILIETYLIASEMFSKLLKNKYSPDLYDMTIKSYYCCDTILRRLVVNISDQNSILDFAKKYKQLTTNLLLIPDFLVKNPEIAFHFASNSKAFQLMANIKAHAIISKENSSIWNNKYELENTLKQLSILKNEAKLKNNNSLVDSLTIVEKDYLIELIVVNYRLMKTQNSEYKYFDDENILQKTTRNVAKSHLLVDIFQTDSIVYVFSIDKTGLSCFSINNADKLNQIANQFYKEIKTGGNYNHSVSLLSNMLLKPLSDKLQVSSQITFIPDNILFQIPFEVLLNPNTGKMLINSHTISYHYSTYLWNKSMNKQVPKEQGILAIAPVFENNQNLTINANFRDRHFDDDYLYKISSKDIPSLPFTGIETKEIVRLFKAKGFLNQLLISNEATKENFLSQSNQYSILHIASHGYVSKTSPNNSGFFLYTIDENPSINKTIGFINMSEVYSLKTNADLVVLSSCNSGVGPVYEGEGLMALPRGFIFAGVPNVIASLWKVHDEKTKDLMLLFYQHLLNGNSYAEALRMAKLDCIAKGDLPINWSGFVIIGR